MTDKVNDHLTQTMHGAPNLKPDEQRKYLGHFRERVIFTMTPSQMLQSDLKDAFQKEVNKYPNAQLLINGNIDALLQTEFMSLSSKLPCQMTIVTNNQMTHSQAQSPFGLVYVDEQAINRETVDIEEIITPNKPSSTKKRVQQKTNEKESKKKNSFLSRLFG